ncbi:Nif3-like dinuclear metal center hexameric protein [Desulfurobacterium sp.]
MNWQNFEKIVREIVPESYAVAGDFYGWVADFRPGKVEHVAVVVDVPHDFDFSKFDVVVAHHKPSFNPNFPVFVVHTPLDRIDWGCNYALGNILGLGNLSFFDDNRFGMYGMIEISPELFLEKVMKVLNLRKVFYHLPEKIEKVAVFSGCGFNFSDFIQNLFKFNIDIAVSGDLVHHTACRLRAAKMGFIDASHYKTEIPGMVEFANRLKDFVDTEFVNVGFPYSDFCLD